MTHQVTVSGTPKPSEEHGSVTAGSSSEGGGSAPSPATSTHGFDNRHEHQNVRRLTPAKPIPGPVASTAVVSRSLASVLKKGLMVSYSVNQQVAGQFQVLLASSLAKRIGLHGPPRPAWPRARRRRS